MEPIGSTSGEDAVEFEVDGRTVRVITRPPGDEGGRLFELGPSPTWNDAIAAHRRGRGQRSCGGLMRTSARDERPVAIVGVTPGAADRVSRRRAHLRHAARSSLLLPARDRRPAWHCTWTSAATAAWRPSGEQRLDLGSDGMWWIVTRLIEALEEPESVAEWPRFLILGTRLGGPGHAGLARSRRLGRAHRLAAPQSGIVGDVIAVQELSVRAGGRLADAAAAPCATTLESHRAHRQRMRPARTAERWARVLERWEPAADRAGRRHRHHLAGGLDEEDPDVPGGVADDERAHRHSGGVEGAPVSARHSGRAHSVKLPDATCTAE